jgi:hypothetical protein
MMVRIATGFNQMWYQSEVNHASCCESFDLLAGLPYTTDRRADELIDIPEIGQ